MKTEITNPTPLIGPLFTDLYELTMAAAYFDAGMDAEASFSLFIRGGRKSTRAYYVTAGLADVLRQLNGLRFSAQDLAYLESTKRFKKAFLDYLADLRFSGEVVALPEGSICFAEEPLLEVTAPVIEAQIIETFVINTIGLQTMIASKAARCIFAAAGRPLVDFGLRRAQGVDAGLKAARSTYLAGFEATSNVLAGQRYGIPISGTMAHSFVTAFDSEQAAFEAYARSFGDSSIFLIDTYDTLNGARIAAKVAADMRRKGHYLTGVRLDSGDMVTLSRQVRHILDTAGCHDVKIFASSGFDEFKIAAVIAEGAEIDAFGVGTKVVVSADAPYLDIVYKLVRYGDRPVRKTSSGKVTLAGKKQLFRITDANGKWREDLIARRTDSLVEARPLLERVMERGELLSDPPSLLQARTYFSDQFAHLPERYKRLKNPATYPVRISTALQALQKTT